MTEMGRNKPSRRSVGLHRGHLRAFSDSLSRLDFSHLRAEGVGMLLTHPLTVRERGDLKAPAPCSDLGEEGRSTPKGPTLSEASSPICARKMPFGHCLRSCACSS